MKSATISLFLILIGFTTCLFFNNFHSQQFKLVPLIASGNLNQDTFVDQRTPDTNYGSSASLYIGEQPMQTDASKIAFLQFDLSNLTIPPEINRVFIRFNMTAQDGLIYQDDFRVHAVTQSWSENTLTWNNQPTYTNKSYYAINGFTFQEKWLKFNQIEITDIFKSWINGSLTNYGIAIESNFNYGNMWFSSLNASDYANRPQIVFDPIDHSLSEPTITSPSPNFPINGTVSVTWNSVQDSNSTHTVFYCLYLSNDSGTTWRSVHFPATESFNLTTTSYDWNTQDFPDGSNYMLKVVAICSGEISSSSISAVIIDNTKPSPNITSYPSEFIFVILCCSILGLVRKVGKKTRI